MAIKKSTQKQKPRKSRSRARHTNLRDKVAFDLIQAKSSVLSAILALEGKGVYTEIATMLRTSALLPIERITAEVGHV